MAPGIVEEQAERFDQWVGWARFQYHALPFRLLRNASFSSSPQCPLDS